MPRNKNTDIILTFGFNPLPRKLPSKINPRYPAKTGHPVSWPKSSNPVPKREPSWNKVKVSAGWAQRVKKVFGSWKYPLIDDFKVPLCPSMPSPLPSDHLEALLQYFKVTIVFQGLGPEDDVSICLTGTRMLLFSPQSHNLRKDCCKLQGTSEIYETQCWRWKGLRKVDAKGGNAWDLGQYMMENPAIYWRHVGTKSRVIALVNPLFIGSFW